MDNHSGSDIVEAKGVRILEENIFDLESLFSGRQRKFLVQLALDDGDGVVQRQRQGDRLTVQLPF